MRSSNGYPAKVGAHLRVTGPIVVTQFRKACEVHGIPASTLTDNGKVERFHQTVKKWLKGQPRAASIVELQTQLDEFVEIYNRRRPHRELPHRATPAIVYAARPKAAPGERIDTHDRVRTDRVDTAAPSPCASPGGFTTSASAEPTPKPVSSYSSKTSTSTSSTPPLASSSES